MPHDSTSKPDGVGSSRTRARLADEYSPSACMHTSMLDGYLAAVASGPNLVMPDQMLRWIWDTENGEDSPEFQPLVKIQSAQVVSIESAPTSGHKTGITSPNLSCLEGNRKLPVVFCRCNDIDLLFWPH